MSSSTHHKALAAAFLLLSSFSLTSAFACTKNNHQRPADQAADEVNRLLAQKDYRQLNRLFDQYSTPTSVTADGISSLSVFYKGISDSFNVCADPDKSEAQWRAHQTALLEWRQFAPAALGPKLALALFAVDDAYRGRGYGDASSIDDATESIFESRMNDAKAQFDRLSKAGKQNAAWYAGMLYLGLGQGWKPATMEALYAKAVKLDPYYIDLHYDIAQYYSPRWYGTNEQMNSAIDRAVTLTEKGLGQTLYTRLHWTLSMSPTMFSKNDVSWPRMKQGFEDYLKLYPEMITRNNYAMFACRANDAATVAEQMKLIGHSVDMNAWNSWAYYDSCKARIN